MPTPSELVKTRPNAGNPFLSIAEFVPLSEKLETSDKSLTQILDKVAEHMSYFKIGSAVIICKGTFGPTKKHLVNLEAIKGSPENNFEDVTAGHPLVHMVSPKYPEVVVLKGEATRRLQTA